jgi:hypothetical protein
VHDGDHASGLEELQAGAAGWEARGAAILRPWHACLLADALLTCRDVEPGLRAVELGLAALAGGERWCEPELHRLRAELLDAGGDRDHAAAAAQLAIVCARRMAAPAWELRASQTLASVHLPRAA